MQNTTDKILSPAAPAAGSVRDICEDDLPGSRLGEKNEQDLKFLQTVSVPKQINVYTTGLMYNLADMPGALLSTKFFVPPVREAGVSRPHLTAKIIDGVRRPGSLTLISSPAGTGKSTLLSEAVGTLRGPVAWVSLDEADNDPARFWTYLVTACQSVVPEVGLGALELFAAHQPLPDDAVPTILINDLSTANQSIVLVLDDYHEIQSPAIHAGLLFLLEHLPPNLHIIISTRIDPPWPLARFRALNRLVEVRAGDLRFNQAEAAEFLNRTMGLAVSAEDAAALEERTEGWIAGLQLAALTLQGRSDVHAFVRDFTGSHLYVAEYLVEEVLQRQDEVMLAFLLHTSILQRMRAGLVEAVTGCPDAQAALQALHRSNTFIVPLDTQGEWFRYHHLFADLLYAHLQQNHTVDEIAGLHARAASWYEDNNFPADAIRHALAARDPERAASLVDRTAFSLLLTGQFNLLKRSLDALPPEIFHAYPRLDVFQVLIDLSQGTLDMSEATLRDKERMVRALPASPENDRLRMEAMVYLSLFMAHQNTERAAQMARDTLAELPPDELRLRISLYSTLYRSYGMDGDIEKSTEAYVECMRLAQTTGEYGIAANTTMVRTYDLCQYARLDEAIHYCQMILKAGDNTKNRVFYPAGLAYIGLAGIHLERYQLQAAEDTIHQGIDLCKQIGLDGLYTGYITQARLLQATGDLPGAAEIVRMLEQDFGRQDFTLTNRQVSLQLATGDTAGLKNLQAPLQAVISGAPGMPNLPLIASEAIKLTLARIRLALGEIERTHRLLDDIQSTVEPGKRDGRLLEVHLLRALAFYAGTNGEIPAETVTELQRALALAEPTGIVLMFLESGPALIPLLRAVLSSPATQTRIREYAQKLLAAFGDATSPIQPTIDQSITGLVEPLTPREVEVLTLIAAGDSNQDIADKLFITVRTAKKHTSNIIAKLGVSNRTQAADRARKLNLLPGD